MTREALRSTVQEIVAGVAPEADLADLRPGENMRKGLDLDSYDFLKILVGVEERLGVNVPEADYGRLASLEDLLDYLEPRVA